MPQLPTIPTPVNKIDNIAGVADKVFGAGVSERDLLAMLLLAVLRAPERLQGNQQPGVAEVGQAVAEAIALVQQLDA